jgi:hypothetical protein
MSLYYFETVKLFSRCTCLIFKEALTCAIVERHCSSCDVEWPNTKGRNPHVHVRHRHWTPPCSKFSLGAEPEHKSREMFKVAFPRVVPSSPSCLLQSRAAGSTSPLMRNPSFITLPQIKQENQCNLITPAGNLLTPSAPGNCNIGTQALCPRQGFPCTWAGIRPQQSLLVRCTSGRAFCTS